MKNFIRIAALVLASTTFAQAQVDVPQPSPAATVSQKVGLTDVKIEYSRPSLKGRTAFGKLVPFNELWRTGANGATKITFSDSVTVLGKGLSKGTYAIFSIPTEGEWTVIFNKNSNQSGTGDYKETEDAARVKVKTTKNNRKVESFNISIDNLSNDGAELIIEWENTAVVVPFATQTDAKVMASIKNVMEGPSAGSYFSAARYYLESGKDMNQALTYVNKAIEKGGEKFWYLRQKALIQEKLGDKKGAIETAQKSAELAKKDGNMDYVRMNEDSIKEWNSKK